MPKIDSFSSYSFRIQSITSSKEHRFQGDRGKGDSAESLTTIGCNGMC